MTEYQGHRSWNCWNVSLWLMNDECMYEYARGLVQRVGEARAARMLARDWEGQRTPDGGIFNHLAIRLAIEGMLD